MRYLILYALSILVFASCEKEETAVITEPVDTTDYSINRIPVFGWEQDTFLYHNHLGHPVDTFYAFKNSSGHTMLRHFKEEYCISIDTTANYYDSAVAKDRVSKSYLIDISKTTRSKKLNYHKLRFQELYVEANEFTGAKSWSGGFFVLETGDGLLLSGEKYGNTNFGDYSWSSIKTGRDAK